MSENNKPDAANLLELSPENELVFEDGKKLDLGG
jgi:hypothetical protein